MEESTLFNLNEADNEYRAYQAILPYLKKTIEDNYAPQNYLNFKKLASCSSIYYDKSLLFRICIRKKSSFFSISQPELFDKTYLYQNKTDEKAGFYRCNIASPEEITRYAGSLCEILDKIINSQPKECDICDLYLVCSNEKKCVHPKRTFALHCGYRRILKSGRIYYGKNRNVD